MADTKRLDGDLRVGFHLLIERELQSGDVDLKLRDLGVALLQFVGEEIGAGVAQGEHTLLTALGDLGDPPLDAREAGIVTWHRLVTAVGCGRSLKLWHPVLLHPDTRGGRAPPRRCAGRKAGGDVRIAEHSVECPTGPAKAWLNDDEGGHGNSSSALCRISLPQDVVPRELAFHQCRGSEGVASDLTGDRVEVSEH
jgi:hypothetical protein